jgi:hypothetical protein
MLCNTTRVQQPFSTQKKKKKKKIQKKTSKKTNKNEKNTDANKLIRISTPGIQS